MVVGVHVVGVHPGGARRALGLQQPLQAQPLQRCLVLRPRAHHQARTGRSAGTVEARCPIPQAHTHACSLTPVPETHFAHAPSLPFDLAGLPPRPPASSLLAADMYAHCECYGGRTLTCGATFLAPLSGPACAHEAWRQAIVEDKDWQGAMLVAFVINKGKRGGGGLRRSTGT